jgi:hypothetical protein
MSIPFNDDGLCVQLHNRLRNVRNFRNDELQKVIKIIFPSRKIVTEV